MLSLRKPSAEKLRGFLAAQSKLGLTYPAVGATAAVPPGGYVVDRTRIRLGGGARTFAAAKAALGRWEQFRLGWVEAWPPVMGQMFVLDAGLGTYFEGFAHSITIPFHHAWVVIDGRPLDFTIEAADRRLWRDKVPPEGPEGIVYLGVEVPPEAVRAFVLKYEVAGPWAHMHYLGATQLFV